MTIEKYVKRLNKCSKKSIAQYLHNRHLSDRALREIELIEYNTRSMELLEEMDRLNKASSEIEIVDVKSKLRFMRLNERWGKLNQELDKLNKWFESRGKVVSDENTNT